MRILIAAFLALALSACASVPDRADPNLLAQLQSAENQRRDIAAAETARANATAQMFASCEKGDAACYMGIALVSREGGSGRGDQVVVPTYTPPRSPGQQFLDILIGLTPIAQAGFNYASQNHMADVNAKTSQVIAGYNAARETATVQAITGLGATIATTDAARAPTYSLGPGAVMAGGDVTQNTAGRDLNTGTQTTTTVGRDQTGGNHTEDRHDSVTCIAGDGGPGGASGDPAAAGGSGAGGQGAAGGSACH